MATVRAKVDCYLASEHGGFKNKGDEFEYSGPKNDNLELVKKAPEPKPDDPKQDDGK